jgi:PAS domain S-box-containing protein
MNTNKPLQNIQLGRSPFVVIAVTTLAAIAISIYCLSRGWVIIFQNLFYFPIIIACVYYTKKGFAFSVVLSFIYFFLIISFTRDSTVIIEALIRVFIFVGIAGVITFLSIMHKWAENVLRDSEVRYRRLFESTKDGILILDAETGMIVDVNPFLIEMLGFSHEQFVGKAIWEIGLFKDIAANKNKFIELQRQEYVRYEDLPLETADGRRIEVEFVSNIYTVDHQKVIQCNIRDITERKRMEEELRQHRENLEKLVKERTAVLKQTVEALRDSEVRYRRLFEAAKDGILILDAETGVIVDVNPFLIEMLGFSHEQFVGKAIWEMGLFKDIASNKDKFVELQRQGYVRYEDLPLETANGRQIDVEFVSNIYTVDHQKVIQCNIRDITVRKQLERELKSKVEMKSKFTSMASHELRSPLGVIKEGINLVLEGLAGNINDEQRDLLDTAKRNTDRLGRLINNVLDFQKMDSGKMCFDIRENDINEAVQEVNKAMSLAAKEKGLDLAVDVEDSIPKMGFDRDKIIQVLTNLVSNAIKYTEKGSITISTKQEDNAMHIIVQDTGIGIKAEDVQKLFRAFEQLGGGIGKKKGGTGLGLAISKEIILAHKGKIWAESKPGKGSTFHFTIPKKLEEKKKIGEILVEEGKISKGDLKKALEKQEKQE